jgi:hypothetical protein
MKKISLISSFCDTEEKIKVLEKNLNILNGMGIDSIVISPFPLPDRIINKCSYFMKTKDNPVLDWPQRSMFSWTEINLNGNPYRMSRTYADYGWAGLHQVKQLSEIAFTLNYDQFFHMIYDLKMDDNIISGLQSDKICSIYPSIRNSQVWKAGLHFMIFDRKNLERFISNIHLDSYLSLRGSDAFGWLDNLHGVFPYNYESEPVEDEIFYYEGHDFYNYSPTEEFSMFIIKDDETKETIKLMFYNVKFPGEYKIKINGNQSDLKIDNYEILDLNVLDHQIQNIEIYYREEVYNITKKIQEVKHNTLRKNE